MRNNICQRLRQLEEKAHIHEAPQPVIFVRFIRPDGQACQSERAQCDGQVWERTPRETLQDFERRVSENLQLHGDSAAVVIVRPETSNP